MRTAAIVALSLVALGAAGCQMGPAPLTQEQRVAIADTAAGIVQKLFTAVNRMDSNAMLDLYAADCVIADNGIIYSTKDSYREALDSSWAGIQGVNTRSTSIRTLVAAPDVAVIMAPVVFTVTAKTGRQVTGQGVLTALVQRRDNKWQIIRSHESEVHLDQLMQQLAPAKAGGRR